MCFSLLWVFVPVLVLHSVVLLKPEGRQRQHCAALSPRKKKGYISVAGFSLSWLRRSSPWCDAGDAWALAGQINAGALSTRDVWLVKELPWTAEGGDTKCQLSPESQSSVRQSVIFVLFHYYSCSTFLFWRLCVKTLNKKNKQTPKHVFAMC